jgi:hypothetical protein
MARGSSLASRFPTGAAQKTGHCPALMKKIAIQAFAVQ